MLTNRRKHPFFSSFLVAGNLNRLFIQFKLLRTQHPTSWGTYWNLLFGCYYILFYILCVNPCLDGSFFWWAFSILKIPIMFASHCYVISILAFFINDEYYIRKFYASAIWLKPIDLLKITTTTSLMYTHSMPGANFSQNLCYNNSQVVNLVCGFRSISKINFRPITRHAVFCIIMKEKLSIS